MSDIDSSGLSDRELEILRLVATGASNKEIAQQLYISTNTVKVHLRNIFHKIDAASRTEAAMYAVQTGLVQPISSENENRDVHPIAISTGQSQKTPSIRWSPTWLVPAVLGFALIISLIGIGIVFGRGSETPPPPTQERIEPTATTSPRWLNLESPPTAREAMAVTAFENELYAIAGRDEMGITGATEKYTPESNEWLKLTPKPLPVADIGAVPLAGGIFVPGGRTSQGGITNIVEMYDPRQDNWVKKSSMPNELSAYAITAFEGNLYLFGGWDGEQFTNTVYMYNPDQDSWLERAPMPTARGYASAIVAGGMIYVLGGTNGDENLTINEIYQPDLDAGLTIPWSEGEPLPFGRSRMGSANIADIIYLIGGEGPDQDITVLAYNPQEETWGQIEAPLPTSWHSLGSSPIGTRLFALGGVTEQGLFKDMWGFQALYTISLPIVR